MKTSFWVHVEIIEKVNASRDPKDDIFLSLAIRAQANAVISGDKDLLTVLKGGRKCRCFYI
jgi:putative PIN family toxin of toxin-antitoxin system